ncbi:hypothetical protein MYX06_04190 [Patescibacteria group bacterium AH-259-L05]|nr:hypothetical protein [Patescibacteria group bacterium AH-259-L05]
MKKRFDILMTKKVKNKFVRIARFMLLGVSILIFLSAIYNIGRLVYEVEELNYDIWGLRDDLRELSGDVEDLVYLSSPSVTPCMEEGKLKHIDIEDVSFLRGLAESRCGGVVLYDDYRTKRLTMYQGQLISHLRFSPSSDKIGFFYKKPGQEYRVTDIELSIIDINTRVITKVYEGGFKGSNWGWLNNKEIVVYHDCGTECTTAFIIDTTSGEQTVALQYGIGYSWSPDKELVLAYRYAVQYGIVIGDKQGVIRFQLLRDSVPSMGNSVVKTLWSPDSAKIALIIKKESEYKMEIIVFDVEQDFKQIFQDDLAGNIDDIGFFWHHKGRALFYKDLNGEQMITF